MTISLQYTKAEKTVSSIFPLSSFESSKEKDANLYARIEQKNVHNSTIVIDIQNGTILSTMSQIVL